MDHLKIEQLKNERIAQLHNMTEQDWIEAEERVESEEYKKEHQEIEEMCNKIKSMPLDTLERIQIAKEASRIIPASAEKVLLFKYLLGIEKEISKSETKFNQNVMYSDEYIEGAEACSSYRDGKCLEEPEKYCDGCASKIARI